MSNLSLTVLSLILLLTRNDFLPEDSYSSCNLTANASSSLIDKSHNCSVVKTPLEVVNLNLFFAASFDEFYNFIPNYG